MLTTLSNEATLYSVHRMLLLHSLFFQMFYSNLLIFLQGYIRHIRDILHVCPFVPLFAGPGLLYFLPITLKNLTIVFYHQKIALLSHNTTV